MIGQLIIPMKWAIVQWKRLDYGIQAGGGLIIQKIAVRITCSFGLANITEYEDTTEKNQTLGISLGYIINKKSPLIFWICRKRIAAGPDMSSSPYERLIFNPHGSERFIGYIGGRLKGWRVGALGANDWSLPA